MKSRVVILVARLLLAGTLIAAGWPKARDPAAFIRDIWNFHLLPESWAYAVAAFFPYLEIATGVALLVGRQRRGAHLLVGLMLPVFLFFHVSAWARGLDIACGCFGAVAGQSTAGHPVWWILLLLAMGAALAWSVRADLSGRPHGAV